MGVKVAFALLTIYASQSLCGHLRGRILIFL